MKVTQRTVAAASAPRPQSSAPRSVFDMGGASDASDDGQPTAPAPARAPAAPANAFTSTPTPAPTPPPETMPQENARTEATPRFQVLGALAAHSKLAPAEITALTALDSRQTGNALYSAKAAGHAQRGVDGKWNITRLGHAWLTGGAKFAARPSTSPAFVKMARRAKPRKGKDLAADEQQRAGVVHIDRNGAPTKPPAAPERAFRCAIFNDGSFFITKNGTEIELDAAEHQQLLTYLDRLAEPLAPHA